MAIGDMTVGTRLRRMREHAGVSQTEMADAGDITQPSYAAYESGRARLPSVKMAPLARRLGLRLDAFAFGLGLDDSDEAAAVFFCWWNELVERRYTLEAAGFRSSVNTASAAPVNTDNGVLNAVESHAKARSTSRSPMLAVPAFAY